MATVNREERARRRARDDGEPDDTVYHSRAWRGSNMAYHADEDCRHLHDANAIVEATRGEAQARSRYPCSRCVTEDGGTGGATGGPSLAQVLQREDVQSMADARDVVGGDA